MDLITPLIDRAAMPKPTFLWLIAALLGNYPAQNIDKSQEQSNLKGASPSETEGSGIVEKLFNYIRNSSGFLYLSILAVGTIISAIFTMLALAGVFKMISRLPPITVTALLLLVVYFFVITGPIMGVKYRLPVEPILTLFVTYFLNRIDRKKPINYTVNCL